MKQTKTDRRSERTRQLISAALIELMREQRYDSITVQDIIDRANVGRSTFYAHYFDKQDVLLSGFTKVLDALSQAIEQPAGADQWGVPTLALFRHVHSHHQLYEALVRGGGIELLFSTGHEHIRRHVEQFLATRVPAGQPPRVPLPLIADYTAGALLTILKWWLDHDLPYTPEQLDAMFQQLVLPGVQAVLQVPAPTSAG